jgi:AAA15 family ATPase/GTPase
LENKLFEMKDYQSGAMLVTNGLILKSSFIDQNNQEKTFVTEIFQIQTELGPQLKQITTKDYEEHLRGFFLNPQFYSHMYIAGQFEKIQIEKRKDRIIKVLKEIEPSIIDLLLGRQNIIYCDIELSKMLPITALGGGILKLLGVLLAIEDNENGIVLIDEIENGLYHVSQDVLWKAIFTSAQMFNVQIFATTHSKECVKSFSSVYSQLKQANDDLRLYRIERKRNEFKVVKYNHEQLNESVDLDWDVR